MIGNTLLAVGAQFMFKGDIVTVERLTATRVYFVNSAPAPSGISPVWVRTETFLSHAETLPDAPRVLGEVSNFKITSEDGTEVLLGNGRLVELHPDITGTTTGRMASTEPAPKPWESEPNSKLFSAYGLKCLILRNPLSGALCGYVRLPRGALYRRLKAYGKVLSPDVKAFSALGMGKGSAFFRRRRRSIYDHHVLRELDVHGGLTFSGSPYHFKTRKGLWLGFDCAHCDDLVPEFLRLGLSAPITSGTYRTVAFVEAELRSLASQIKALTTKD